jgi:hypothetical protein
LEPSHFFTGPDRVLVSRAPLARDPHRARKRTPRRVSDACFVSFPSDSGQGAGLRPSGPEASGRGKRGKRAGPCVLGSSEEGARSSSP